MARPRPNAKCHYCPDWATTWDHIVPRGKGGSNWPINKVPACLSCNREKADNMPTCDCEKCREALRLWSGSQLQTYRPAPPGKWEDVDIDLFRPSARRAARLSRGQQRAQERANLAKKERPNVVVEEYRD